MSTNKKYKKGTKKTKKSKADNNSKSAAVSSGDSKIKLDRSSAEP